MNSFEGLRPIMTQHFTLDWLTKFKLPEVIHFQQRTDTNADVHNTSDFINATMNDVMSKKALLWGVMNQQTHEFVGMAGIANLNQEEVTIYVNLVDMSADDVLEITHRVMQLQKEYWPNAKRRFNITPHDKEIRDKIGFLAN